ncbi:hypothetical protein A4G19_07040 [Pasteurellaceae bacterium Macca]|nr:hypothetical protein [Pasteurellaceae bacterium Macca]
MNVVFAVDKNYFPYLETTLKSLMCYHENLDIFVLHKDDVDLAYFERLNRYLAQRGSTIRSAQLNQDEFSGYLGAGYISSASFFRYYIEQLFPYGNGNHWLYLDCDLIVNDTLYEPFQLLDNAEQNRTEQNRTEQSRIILLQ